MENRFIKEYKQDDISFIQVTNKISFVVTFASLGAAIFSIDFLGRPMTYEPKNTMDFLRKNVYHGKTIGRVAGRIEGNELTIDGVTYKLSANEKGNVLHGGSEGFSSREFASRTFVDNNFIHVIYSYLSKDEESGFPGDINLEVHYFVSIIKPELKVEYTCTTNKKCPISLTNHSYFCLGDVNVYDLNLQINASKLVLMNNEDLTIVVSSPVPSYLDFRKLKRIGDEINIPEINQGKLKGYDHILLLDKIDINNPQVKLVNSRFELDIFTDLDTVVFYTDNYDAGFEANNSDENIRRGIALEPQLNPLNNRILNPGDAYKHFITYKFVQKERTTM